MVLGQTVANMIGVPAGTLMASMFSWHAPFVFAAAWAVLAAVLIHRFVPVLDAIPDAGLAGQFAFLKAPGPWFILAAVLLGNTGIFCWWSYVSPWLQHMGGFAESMVPMLLVLAGAGGWFYLKKRRSHKRADETNLDWNDWEDETDAQGWNSSENPEETKP